MSQSNAHNLCWNPQIIGVIFSLFLTFKDFCVAFAFTFSRIAKLLYYAGTVPHPLIDQAPDWSTMYAQKVSYIIIINYYINPCWKQS